MQPVSRLTRESRLTPKLVLLVAGALLAMGVAVAISTSADAKKPGSNPLTQQVTGTVEGASNTFQGTETINRFDVQNGNLVAVGTVSGTIQDASGNTVQTLTNEPFTQQVSVAQATCQVLSLQLGPLNLDVLGLVIDLNQVNLDLTAQQGSGNLLGNLLCAVAGLADNSGGGALNGIANLLNQILSIL